MVLNYQELRNKCLDYKNVKKALSLKEDDVDLTSFSNNGSIADNELKMTLIQQMMSNNNPIGKDLEERSKRLTLQALKNQGKQYEKFNKQLLYLMQPDRYQNTVQAGKSELNLDEVEDNVNKGLQFQEKLE